MKRRRRPPPIPLEGCDGRLPATHEPLIAIGRDPTGSVGFAFSLDVSMLRAMPGAELANVASLLELMHREVTEIAFEGL